MEKNGEYTEKSPSYSKKMPKILDEKVEKKVSKKKDAPVPFLDKASKKIK